MAKAEWAPGVVVTVEVLEDHHAELRVLAGEALVDAAKPHPAAAIPHQGDLGGGREREEGIDGRFWRR